MKKINYQKGSGDIGLILAVIIGLFLIWLIFGGANKVNDQSLFIDNPLESMANDVR